MLLIKINIQDNNEAIHWPTLFQFVGLAHELKSSDLGLSELISISWEMSDEVTRF